jgi:hypothetical protein
VQATEGNTKSIIVGGSGHDVIYLRDIKRFVLRMGKVGRREVRHI